MQLTIPTFPPRDKYVKAFDLSAFAENAVAAARYVSEALTLHEAERYSEGWANRAILRAAFGTGSNPSRLEIAEGLLSGATAEGSHVSVYLEIAFGPVSLRRWPRSDGGKDKKRKEAIAYEARVEELTLTDNLDGFDDEQALHGMLGLYAGHAKYERAARGVLAYYYDKDLKYLLDG